MRFDHETLPQRIRFATGDAAANLAVEIEALSITRVMVIAAATKRELALNVAGTLPVAHWHHGIAMHVPVEVAQRGRAAATAHNVDGLVSIGGGSTTGLAKAIALTTGLPIVAVPTTYAGSEATNVWGMTENTRKITGVDDRVLPRAIVYDAQLTRTLPVGMSVASGLNALAHCVDSMWAPRADPINRAVAGEAIQALRLGLPGIVREPTELESREHTLYGAYLSAMAFASAGSGLHHKICHVLGGMFDLPHAQTHAIVLPHVLAFNVGCAPVAERRIAAALSASGAVEGLNTLYKQLDVPRALRDYGMLEEGIAAAAAAVLAAAPAGNPHPVGLRDITALLQAAWKGSDPQ